jgi:hypothetical protein
LGGINIPYPCALPIDCDSTTALWLFLQKSARNMGQESITPPILTIPQELFVTIASFMDVRSQLALAMTCKTLYGYHKAQCTKQTFTLISVPRCHLFDSIFGSIRGLEKSMSQKTGWVTTEITLKKAPPNDENEYPYPVRGLYLCGVLDLPNGLNCANITALSLELNPKETSLQLSIFFLKKFYNLKSLRLCCLTLNNDVMSMLPQFSLLELISLHNCEITEDHLSKLFESCATLEIHIVCCRLPLGQLIKLPKQMKRFRIQHFREVEIDASDCTQLSYL